MSSHEPLLPPWFLTYLLPAKWFLKNTTTSSMMMVLRKKVGSGSIQDDAMIFSHWKWNLLIFRKMLFKTSLDLDFTSRWIFNGGSKSFAMKWPSISAKKNKIRPFTFLARILIFCIISSGLWNFADFMVLDKIIKLEFLIFHSRNSHRQSTRKRWQNRSRRNWAQMASSANNNAMQKGKNFFKSKIILAARILVESSLQRSVTFPFFPSISPNHAEKTTYNYAVVVHKLNLTFCGLNLG